MIIQPEKLIDTKRIKSNLKFPEIETDLLKDTTGWKMFSIEQYDEIKMKFVISSKDGRFVYLTIPLHHTNLVFLSEIWDGFEYGKKRVFAVAYLSPLGSGSFTDGFVLDSDDIFVL